VRDPQEFMRNLKIDLYPEEVYIFTPKGEVKSLPRGATAVDFAYAVHTDVGHQCVGARINGRMVPLRTHLQNGDIIEIITQTGHKPSRDWLTFVVTSRARSKVRHVLQAEERARSIDLGRRLFDKEVRRFGLNPKNILESEELAKFASEYGAQKVDDLLTHIGYGRLSARTVLQKAVPPALLKEKPPESGVVSAVKRVLRSGAAENRIKVRGTDEVLVFRAKCCNPIRGERIVGYITRGKGVSVHAASCPNVLNLMFDPDRRIDVEWDAAGADHAPYRVRLTMQVEDRRGMLAEISAKVSDINTNITNMEARTGTGTDHQARIDMTVEIQDVKHLERVIKSIKAVDGVLGVERAARA
jgi:GTP pyrophosphokinase